MTTTTPAHAPKPAVKEKDRDPVAAGKRDAAFNRSASFNYFLTDKFEAGLALRGTEVKSIREGKANLKDAYGLLKDGECFLLNAHIGPFSHGNCARASFCCISRRSASSKPPPSRKASR
jgi:SsrA-binding protein